ncbi:hypothetical protein MHEI_37250 [Mycobacterium heidelbergense]|nr:hypothetical protein MHEI_37250 [Mycobacterium heidelbergense]
MTQADPAARVTPVDLAAQVVRVDPRPVIRVVPADPKAPADPVAPVDLAARVGPRPVTRANQVAPAGPAGQADPRPATPAVRVDPVDRAGPAARAVPAGHGMAIPSAVTSTTPRGATDPHPGDMVSRLGQLGTGRSRLPVGNGGTAPSTTSDTTKRPCGIPDSTSGASGSSGSGSRCKTSDRTDCRFANWRGGRRRDRVGLSPGHFGSISSIAAAQSRSDGLPLGAHGYQIGHDPRPGRSPDTVLIADGESRFLE